MAILKSWAVLGVAYRACRTASFRSSPPPLIKLLWLRRSHARVLDSPWLSRAATGGAATTLSAVELVAVILRFLVVVIGLQSGVEFFWVVIAQTLVQVILGLGPALWVMVGLRTCLISRGTWPITRCWGTLVSTWRLIQISIVMADKLDTTVLGFVLSADPEPAITVYNLISKPFLQLRQTGWMLAYMVMPAVASLAAAGDLHGLERVKYDGARSPHRRPAAGWALGLDLCQSVLVALDRRPGMDRDAQTGLRPGKCGGIDAAIPDRRDFVVALSPRPDGHRHQQDQSDCTLCASPGHSSTYRSVAT